MDVYTIAQALERDFPGLTRRGRWPDRRGEYHMPCPFHGERRDNSFSFSERGFKCFACGSSGGLATLADRLGLGGPTPLPLPPRRPRPVPPPQPWRTDRRILDRFSPILPGVAWRYLYTHGVDRRMASRAELRWGVLPASRDRRPRLIVPVRYHGEVVQLRGRAMWGEEPRWLQAAGGEAVLYNQDDLERSLGQPVVVCESPLGAIAYAETHPGAVVVASTAGAGSWPDGWTEAIRQAMPTSVTVLYDHDPAGMRGAAKVANQLLQAGIPARVHRWAPGRPATWDANDEVARERVTAWQVQWALA